MSKAERTQDILGLEREFWNAMKEKDGARAARMTADDCIVVGAQGVSAVKSAEMEKMTNEGAWELEKFDFDEKNAKVQFIGDDLAIVAYTVNERVTVDGKTLGLTANDASVWRRQKGAWKCAMHTESLKGDPYGRDRMASGAPA